MAAEILGQEKVNLEVPSERGLVVRAQGRSWL